MNQIILMGRLTREPEMKNYGKEGKVYARFGLAVDRPGKERKADFIDCLAFGHTGEFIGNYADKGARILVEGALKIERHVDKFGNAAKSVNVMVSHAELIDWPEKDRTKSDKANNTNPMSGFGEEAGFDEEIPF